jgi:hypothetical protein
MHGQIWVTGVDIIQVLVHLVFFTEWWMAGEDISADFPTKKGQPFQHLSKQSQHLLHSDQSHGTMQHMHPAAV